MSKRADTHKLEIQKTADPNVPNVNTTCGRVSVILGSNGAGKSRLLAWINSYLSTQRKPYQYVEGARLVKDVLASMRIEHNLWEAYGTPEKAENSYKQQRGSELSNRARHSLLLLRQRSEAQKRAFYDSLKQWDKSGRQASAPMERESALETAVRLYRDVFPYLNVTVNLND